MLKLKLKLLVIGIPIFLVIILLIGVASIFYGLPFGNTIAQHYIKQYSDVKYSNIEHTIGNTSYNFKDSAYHASILDSNGSLITEIAYNLGANSLHDSSYNEEISKDFKANINSLLSKEYPSIKTTFVYIWEEVDANQDFNKANLKKKHRIDVYMNDKATLASTEESKIKFAEVLKMIFSSVESQYDAESSQIIYDNHHDMMEVRIGTKQSKLPNEELKKLIRVIHTYDGTENPTVKVDTVTVDNIDKFIDYVHQDLSAKYQVTQTTEEGDAITQTLEYDGTIINLLPNSQKLVKA